MGDKTKVVFLVWIPSLSYKFDDVIALFPEIKEGSGLCLSYEHFGQHGAADYLTVISRTRPARPCEYAALKAELEGRGYNLEVRKRR